MDEIKVEQLLFGYDNGHRILSTSLENRLFQQNDMEILSDASGNGRFDNYITCFPLVKDSYYVFSKTWYADEMERPGCVWTHALLIHFDDLKKNAGYINLQSLFHRPNVEEQYDRYKEKIYLKRDKAILHSSYYHYVVYTMFYCSKKVLIEDSMFEEYEPAVLDILTKMPIEILKHFSVCTCSHLNRYINDEVFSYQVTYIGNAKKLARDLEDVILYKSKNAIEEYPLWVKYLVEKFESNSQDELYKFCLAYQNYDRLFIQEFSKLLYAMKEFQSKENLKEFLTLSSKLDLGTSIHDKTLELLFVQDDKAMNERFREKSIIDQLVFEMQNKEGIFVKEKLRDDVIVKHAKRLYKERDKRRIYKIFEKFIHKELNKNGEKIVRKIIELLKPTDLNDLFNMNKNICSVLVSIDSRFLKCENIWQQNMNYQLEMLNCVRGKRLSDVNGILMSIIDNSKENIGEEVYEIFGDSLIDCLYAYYEDAIIHDVYQIDSWIPYLVLNKGRYVGFLPKISNVEVLLALMDNVDSYAIFETSELEAWIDACNRNIEFIKGKYEYIVAVFLLPIILRYDKPPKRIINLVYDVLYRKLEKSEMDYHDWKKIEVLLPQVDIEQSWDKCLRLRLAFGR